LRVKLKNQGKEAYKPKDFGKSITIERKIAREGSGGYKIKGADGKTPHIDLICI
jgi:structural maintenance of chromosomes protein 6